MPGEALTADRAGGREALLKGQLRRALPLGSGRFSAGFAEETGCPSGKLFETPDVNSEASASTVRVASGAP